MSIFNNLKLFFKKDEKPTRTYYCLNYKDVLPHICCDESHIEEGIFKKTGRSREFFNTGDIIVEVIPTLKYYEKDRESRLKKIDSLKAEIAKLEGEGK